VTRELEAAGIEVVGLNDGLPGASSNLKHVDLLDRPLLHSAVKAIKPDLVLHLAAIAFVAHGDVDEIYRVNVVGTRNLLDALAGLDDVPRRVVLASSANIYGNTDVDPIGEDVPAAPANDYAVSKLAMEYMARIWSDRLPIVLARPFNYTGVGQSEQFLIPKIVGHFRRREKVIELGNLAVARDFGDVRDVAMAYRGLVQSERAVGRVFNICTGIGHTLGEVLAMMREIAGFDIEVRVNPAFVRANDVQRLVGSNAAISDVVDGTRARPLRETLEWMYRQA
jgi:nucleoside-diphosphate-sugar epimerase